MPSSGISKDEVFASLPAPWPHELMGDIQRQVAASEKCFVVLDDDPTGGQTLHGMPVLARWDSETLEAEVESSRAFFLLTNSRAASEAEAVRLAEQIGGQLSGVSARSGREIVVGSRGDSTLRGHFPEETDALYWAMTGGDEPPTYIFAPYFGEGGRFTIDDTQYVQQGTMLVQVAETEFARDPAFAFAHSHLPSWLASRRRRDGGTLDVVSVSIAELRQGGPDAVAEKLAAAPRGSTIIMNAVEDRDVEVFVAGLLRAEAGGRRFLYHTAASFVRVRAGIAPRPPLARDELGCSSGSGGLVLVGSYVDRTSQQLDGLLSRDGVVGVELRVERLFDAEAVGEIARAAAEVRRGQLAGSDVVLFTSREVMRGPGLDSREVGRRISDAIAEVLRRQEQRPDFLVVKGGNTACRVAIDGLGVQRSVVLGQLLPGVPVWRLGEESRFPGLPYVIFPGNVGEPDSLDRAVSILRGGA